MEQALLGADQVLPGVVPWSQVVADPSVPRGIILTPGLVRHTIAPLEAPLLALENRAPRRGIVSVSTQAHCRVTSVSAMRRPGLRGRVLTTITSSVIPFAVTLFEAHPIVLGTMVTKGLVRLTAIYVV